MRFMRSRLTLAAFLIAVGVAFLALRPDAPAQATKDPPKPPASRARPIPAVDFRIPWNSTVILGMHAESNRPVLGRPNPNIQPSDLRYFYVPLFAFLRKETGELDVTVSDQGEITLPMVYDNEEARQAVRDYLVNEKLIPADSMPGQVQAVPARVWYLETAPGYEPHVKFGPYEYFQFPWNGQLHTSLSPDLAQKFVNDLKAGAVQMQSTVVFDGYTYQDNSLVISADDILDSNQFRKLTGAGGEGKVGRHQTARILREACLKRGIIVTNEYHDADFDELVTAIIRQYCATETRLTPDWDKVEAEFKREGWDPNDFKADLIEASKYNENKEARDQFSSDVSKSFGSSASASAFGLFSGSASFNYGSNEKIARDVFSKWGMQTEFQGKKFIPKSVDVHTMNTAKIRQTGTFVVGKRKKTVSDGILTVAVNSKENVLRPRASAAYEERLAEINRYLTRVHKQGMLGKVEIKKKNTTYTAQTDGILVVMRGGNAPPEFAVQVDGHMAARSERGYHSVACPIKRGQSWIVQTYNDTTGSDEGCIPRWTPLQVPEPPKN